MHCILGLYHEFLFCFSVDVLGGFAQAVVEVLSVLCFQGAVLDRGVATGEGEVGMAGVQGVFLQPGDHGAVGLMQTDSGRRIDVAELVGEDAAVVGHFDGVVSVSGGDLSGVAGV